MEQPELLVVRDRSKSSLEVLGRMLTSVVIEEAVRKLGSAITDETLVRWNLTQGLEEMKATLENEGHSGKLVEANIMWLNHLRDAAYNISDMVDAYHADAAKGKPAPAAGTTLTGMLPCLETQSKFTMSRKINRVHAGLKKLILEKSRLLITDKASSRGITDMWKISSALEEEGFVGRMEEKQSIINQLSYASDTRQGGTVVILPIFGLGGVGKTTLAQMVFADTNFRDYCCAWVYVSQNYHITNICSSITSQLQHMESMRERPDEVLGNKKTLIVLDDLWELKDPELENLKNLFSSVGTEVIVIVTTRSEDIATKISTLVPYKLEPLDDDMCWTIIERLTSLEDRPDKQELQQIGRDIAKKCGGLPLAAKELGRRLRGIRTPTEWSALRNSDIWDTQHSLLLPSLILSYQHIPRHMRLCFAYLATYPKGHNIVKDDLIHQWMSLGLIEPSDISSMTQLAEEYITMFFGISFLQPAKSTSTSTNDDKVSMSFTMHDVVHSLAVAAFGDDLVVWDTRHPYREDGEFYRYALVSNVGIASWELSTTVVVRLRMLRFIGCNITELSDGMFSSAKCLRVLEFRECSLKKLPDSICQLKQLRYLNLSGCFRLVNLIESFRNLGNLLYLDLSGCYGLVKLPESIGYLVNLVHLDLSGCCGLVKLPESIGDLIHLVHLDLSGCCGLVKLPESIGKLINLVHLDLSFCRCSEGIPEALGGLTNIEHLNLSHFGSYVGEHRYCLGKLDTVWTKLRKLRYLNLSMCLNPLSYYLQGNECIEQFSFLSELVSLEHLDLSHNIFLTGLPDQSLRGLDRLHTLDLSGCIRLKSVDRWMFEFNFLTILVLRNCRGLECFQFMVRHDYSNLSLLEDVECTELDITCLEEIKTIEEARKIRLAEKHKLRKLKLAWSVGGHGSVEDNAWLGEFVPPSGLQFLELHGYGGTCLPAWMTYGICSRLPNLVEVTMEDIPRCSALPPFGLLTKLKRLVLRRMAGITKIDAGVLSGGNRAAFRWFFTIQDMENLVEFNTTYFSDGEEFMFPAIDELVVQSCPKLRFTPSPPTAQRLEISGCDKAMSSLLKRGHGEGSSSSSSSCSTSAISPPRVTQLVVKNCNVPLGDWSLLHHLPGLQTLEIINCNDLSCSKEIIGLLLVLPSLKSLSFSQCSSMTSLPDSMQHLASIESMHFSACNRITTLPEWFGQLTSLQKLTLDECYAIPSLPESILKLTNLKVLLIQNCPDLIKWCKLPENKKKLTEVPITYQDQKGTAYIESNKVHTAGDTSVHGVA